MTNGELEQQVQHARQRWEEAVDALERLNQKLERMEHITPDVERRSDELIARVESAREEYERLERKRDERRQAIQRARLATLPDPDTNMNQTTEARVTSEPLTYEKANHRRSFFQDLYAATRLGDMQARQRLERHQQEMRVEKRDLSSTDGVGGEFIPPLWMQNEWIPLARASRPFANVVRSMPLPEGTDSINVPKVLTGSSTAAHADLGAVSETDPTTGSVSVPIKTIAGQVDMSRQSFERSVPGLDQIVFGDLVADYNLRLDLQLLTGSGSGANAKGVLSDSNRIQVTWTDASPTVGELYSKIADASQQVVSNIYRQPTHVVMHPRRWAFILAASDTTGRPLVSPVAQQNSPATFGVTAEGVVGQLQGLQVVVDPNLPTNQGAGTNEDVVIITRAQELVLFEMANPVTRVFEDVLSGNLAVRCQVYGYYGFTSERLSKATASISGTGLTPPSFT